MTIRSAAGETLQRYADQHFSGNISKVKDYLAVAQPFIEKQHSVRLSFAELRSIIDDRVAAQSARGRAGHAIFVGQQNANIAQVNTGNPTANIKSGPLFAAHGALARMIENRTHVEQATLAANSAWMSAQTMKTICADGIPPNDSWSHQILGGLWREVETQRSQLLGYLEAQLKHVNGGGTLETADLKQVLAAFDAKVARFAAEGMDVASKARRAQTRKTIIDNMR